jgi:hypothetical protein
VPLKEETGYGDPLSDCTDFNIIQFINDNDTPIDSPADPAFLRAGNYQAQQQHQLLTGAPSNHNTALHCNTTNSSNGHQHNGWAGAYQTSGHNGGMFSTNQSLPDSPPITDISGNGSSGSPSTNSEPPYSPDQYPYAAIHPNRNMILSMQNMHGLDSQILLPPELQPMLRGGIITHQTQHSPQSEFLSPYPPQTPGSHTSQVSPPAVDPRCPSNYMLPQQNYSVDMYGNILEPMSDQNGCNPPNIDPPNNKRKRTESGMTIVKNEPSPRIYGGGLPQPLQMQNRPMSVSLDEYDENFHCQKAIKVGKFAPFNENVWRQLYTVNQRPVNLKVDVVADKGFNYSASDGCFVNQKKNHFQITVHIETQDELPPKLIKIDDKLKQVKEFKLAFCGVKAEMTNSEIQIRQSQTDRKPIPHEPVHLEILERRVTKVTVPRLHFSETTMNNHRKNGKPNPEQKYFLLVVQLIATTDDGQYIVKAYQSDKVIVRASNPGQFEPPENESEKWIKTGNTLHYPGQVVVGGDRALSDNSLTVHGNIAMTGQITRPSDRRLKEDIEPVPTNEALSRVSQLRVVEYNYKPEVAQQWNMDNRHRVGLIAQELAEVIPDAVRENGEFLTIDDSRVFYDTVAAAQELYRLTGNLENKIDEVEQISKKLAKFSKKKQQFGSTISGLSGLTQWMNGDDGKSLSYSRTSLASSTPSCDSDATHRRGRRDSKNAKACRHYCQHNAVPLCSSKVTQGTIIALVIVMALCLVTMCSIYVLDWYNRTYNAVPLRSYYIPPNTNITCTHEYGCGGMTDKLPPGVKNSWLPKAQPKAPILAPFCGPKSDCPIFCCAENHQYNFESGRQNDDSVSIVALPKGPKSPIELRTNPGQQPSITNGFSIEVVNLNVTLDERFCVEGSCIPRSGHYNYFVPVSAYMPTIPLHLRFNIPDGKFVDGCGSIRDFDHKTCQVNYDDKKVVDADDFKEPKSYRLSEETFELTVGGFMQSAYQFRVGYSTESCNMSEDQRGRSFDEYNIFFYRKCSPNSTL